MILCFVGVSKSLVIESFNFKNFDSVKQSFTFLSYEVVKLLQKIDYLHLKLTCNRIVTDVQLSNHFCSKIQSCSNTDELLSALTLSPYWNWMDIRLMEAVAAISHEVMELLKRYKEYLLPQSLVELLSFIPTVGKDDESNYKIMSIKLQKVINDVTLNDFYSDRHFLETEILNLKEGALVLKHIEKKTFNINWLIPVDQCLHAHKSAKENVEKFHKISLSFVHIEPYEAINQVHTYICNYR